MDSENTTKVEDEKKAEDVAALEGDGENLLSLESLDNVISEADPEFSKSLEDIGPDDGTSIYEEGLELQYTIEDEIKLWQTATGKKAKLLKLFPFLPKLSFQIKMKRMALRLAWVKRKRAARDFIINFGPWLIESLTDLLHGMKKGLSAGMKRFKELSGLKKLVFFVLLVATGAGGVVLYKVVTHGLIPKNEDLFIGSLSEWAGQKYQFDPKADMESFYESTRTPQNIIVTKKLMVNLKRSAESGLNPMGAFEFYIEGAASDVVVEIKDREFEMNDLFLRTIEDMSYDQVASGEGKQLLCENLKKAVNKILTKGYVRRVFIKTVIVKP